MWTAYCGSCRASLLLGVKVGREPVALVALKRLESTPDHAALRARHAANEHAGVVLDVLGNKHAGLRGATRVRAGHGVGEAGSTRVAKLLDGAPCAEAGVAGFALGAARVVTGVLVERDGLGEVRCTDDVATATAVVLAEVPCEVGLAESACVGRLVRLERDVSVWSSRYSRAACKVCCVCLG